MYRRALPGVGGAAAGAATGARVMPARAHERRPNRCGPPRRPAPRWTPRVAAAAARRRRHRRGGSPSPVRHRAPLGAAPPRDEPIPRPQRTRARVNGGSGRRADPGAAAAARAASRAVRGRRRSRLSREAVDANGLGGGGGDRTAAPRRRRAGRAPGVGAAASAPIRISASNRGVTPRRAPPPPPSAATAAASSPRTAASASSLAAHRSPRGGSFTPGVPGGTCLSVSRPILGVEKLGGRASDGPAAARRRARRAACVRTPNPNFSRPA